MTVCKYAYDTSYKFINYGDKQLEHFWNFVEVDKELGCWIWKGALRTKGEKGSYGCFWDGKKVVQSHRFSYEVNKGKIPDGLELDHTCHNTLCVNPDHLQAVTHKINSGVNAIYTRSYQEFCKRGHALVPQNLKISSDGKKRCLACIRLRGRINYTNKKIGSLQSSRS